MLSGGAPNTLKLDGTSASGFYQVGNCSDLNMVWKGIDNNGVAICGLRAPLLTMQIDLIEGTAKINGTSHSAPYSFTTTGGTLENISGNPVTFQFQEDKSILRLDNNTRVKLVGGFSSDNKTLAQVNLEY